MFSYFLLVSSALKGYLLAIPSFLENKSGAFRAFSVKKSGYTEGKLRVLESPEGRYLQLVRPGNEAERQLEG